VYVAADEQGALAFVSAKTVAPTPPVQWQWAGDPLPGVALGWRTDSQTTLVYAYRCFAGFWHSSLAPGAGRPEQVVESAARAWRERCDTALAWCDAPEEKLRIDALGVDLPTRLVNGVQVCSLADVVEAVVGERHAEEDGEVEVVKLGNRTVRLVVGYPWAEADGRQAQLRFPSLRVDDQVLLCDAERVVALLRAPAAEGAP